MPWSYRQPVRTAEASTQTDDRGVLSNEIDRFVVAKLRQRGIDPAPPATPRQWLRRVTLDLTGLPPTPRQLEQFEFDSDRRGDIAYAAAVDRLLIDPGVGQRWASVWLDQIRYADSRGLGLDTDRNAWPYRDWVIAAINEDLPYDQFTIRQIAGDLPPGATLNDRLATAAHRLTQTNEEGGTDDEEFRVEAVIDRVSTIWQTWQGVTFGCVQCHSHPYDPITHEEFYRFAAFFNNTADVDLNQEWPVLQVPNDPADQAVADRLDDQINRLQEQIWNAERRVVEQDPGWTPLVWTSAGSDKETTITIENTPDPTGVTRSQFFAGSMLSNGTTFTLTAEVPEDIAQISGLQVTSRTRRPLCAVVRLGVGHAWHQQGRLGRGRSCREMSPDRSTRRGAAGRPV